LPTIYEIEHQATQARRVADVLAAPNQARGAAQTYSGALRASTLLSSGFLVL